MTCIVAFNDGKTLWMGGDSSSYGDGVNQIISSKKVFNKNGFTIGYTTSFRMGQILEHYWPDIYIDPALELESEIVTKVVPAIRKVLKEHGYIKIDNNREESGSFLLGFNNKIFNIDSDLQATPIQNYSAAGSGEEIALGSLFTSNKLGLNGEDAVLHALEAASLHNFAVRPPFTVIKNSS